MEKEIGCEDFAFRTKKRFMLSYFLELDQNRSSYLEREEVEFALKKIYKDKVFQKSVWNT